MSIRPADYKYSPLQRPRDVRIIELGVTPLNDLKCLITHFSLNNAPPYQAISYCWGSPDDRSQVGIFDHFDTNTEHLVSWSLSIPHNLYEALRNLQRSTGCCYVWADAICIDQSNLQERSQQVRIMADIYKRAERVVVWLGLEDSSTQLALGYIQQIAERLTLESRDELRKMRISGGLLMQWLGMPVPAVDTKGRDAAVQLICGRPWFSRIWVVQEVCFAREIVVLIGDHKVSWDELGLAAFWLAEHLQIFECDRRYIQLFNTTYMWQRRFLSAPSDRILPLGRGWQASDARDMIYSLLGFSNLRTDMPIIPDYTIDHVQLFKDVVITMIKNTGKLTIFKSIDHGLERDTLRISPSWVPRWDITRTVSTTGDDVYIKSTVIRDWPAVMHCITEDHMVLTLRGWRSDEVVYVSPAVQFQMAVDPPTFLGFEAISTLWDAASNITEPLTAVGSLMASLATAISGNVGVEILPADRDEMSMNLQIKCFKAALLHSVQAMIDPILKEQMKHWLHDRLVLPSNEDFSQHLAIKFLIIARQALHNRRCFVTERGLIGLGPSYTQPGDTVASLFGAYQPLILRSDGRFYNLVGFSSIYGLMDESIERFKSKNLQIQEFQLR